MKSKKILSFKSQPTKHETYNNQNIYTNDSNAYKMNKYHKFENAQEEALCNLDLFARYLDLVKIFVIIMIVLQLFDIIIPDKKDNFLIYSIRFIDIGLLIYSLNLLFNLDRLKNNVYNIRVILELDVILYFITIAINSKFFIYFKIFNAYSFSLFLNIIFSTGLENSIYFYIVESTIYLLFLNSDYSSFILLKVFYNAFYNIIYLTITLLTILFLEYIISKMSKELWALFDSFKRSYAYFKDLIDSSPYPLIIVNKAKIDQILYKNTEADKMYKKILLERRKGNVNQKSSMTNVSKNTRFNTIK